MSEPLRDSRDACVDCPLVPGRREFLKDGAGLVIGAILLMTGARSAAAFPLRTAHPTRKGDTVRYPVPTEDGADIDHDNDVIIVRWQGEVYAFNLACPHQNTALRWIGEESRFQCPKHHSKYQPDGTFIDGRATRNMDRLGIKRDGDNIVVDLDTMYQSDKDPVGWAAAAIPLK